MHIQTITTLTDNTKNSGPSCMKFNSNRPVLNNVFRLNLAKKVVLSNTELLDKSVQLLKCF